MIEEGIKNFFHITRGKLVVSMAMVAIGIFSFTVLCVVSGGGLSEAVNLLCPILGSPFIVPIYVVTVYLKNIPILGDLWGLAIILGLYNYSVSCILVWAFNRVRKK